jgi:pimeloyl-ACP methyl ester carboxylesterase
VILEAEAIQGRFQGELDDAVNTIEGVWTQGAGFPLILKRIASEEETGRPQDPSPPYSYREEEVQYKNRQADLELAGTFTIPVGAGPFPAVLLIAGSGALDRDESMNGHRPFLVLADWLTRRGIAVLRVDKRGVGDSGGKLIDATTTDLATDAEAALEYLGRRPEVNGGSIGIVGHSEGGLIACMVAARNQAAAFIVLMAAPGVPGWELAGQQARRSAEIHGLDPKRAEERSLQVRVLLRNEKDDSVLSFKLQRAFSDVPEPQRSETVKILSLPWHRHFVSLNPADYIKRLKCPVLALNGEKDISVESSSNLGMIRQALIAGSNPNFEVIELSGLNHLFQTCTTGLETEYGQIEETLAPAVLETIAGWIRKCVQG